MLLYVYLIELDESMFRNKRMKLSFYELRTNTTIILKLRINAYSLILRATGSAIL